MDREGFAQFSLSDRPRLRLGNNRAKLVGCFGQTILDMGAIPINSTRFAFRFTQSSLVASHSLIEKRFMAGRESSALSEVEGQAQKYVFSIHAKK